MGVEVGGLGFGVWEGAEGVPSLGAALCFFLVGRLGMVVWRGLWDGKEDVFFWVGV